MNTIPQEHKDIMAEMIRRYTKEHNLVPPGDTLEVQVRLRSEIPYLYDDACKSFREFCERTGGDSKHVMTRVLNIFQSRGLKTVKDVASYGTKGNESWDRIRNINLYCKSMRAIKEWLSSLGLGTHMSFNFLND